MAESHHVLRPTGGITVQDSERPLEVGKVHGDEIYKDTKCLGHWQILNGDEIPRVETDQAESHHVLRPTEGITV